MEETKLENGEPFDQNTRIAAERILLIGATCKFLLRIASYKLPFLADHLPLRKEEIHELIYRDPDPQIPQKHYRAQALVAGRPFICLFDMRNL